MCFGRENGPACVEVYLAGAIIIVDPLHSHHKLSGRIEQEAARAFVIKFYAEAKFKRASRFSRYRRGTWMQRPTLSLLASLKTPSEQAREQAASNSRAINDENSGIQGGGRVRDGRRLSAF